MQNEEACLLFAFEFLHADFAADCWQTGVWDKVDAVSQSVLQFSWAAVICFALSFVFSVLLGTDRIFFSFKEIY